MNAPEPTKPYKYIAYIDEAGDFGLRNVAPIDQRGASEWLILGAAVIRAEAETETIEAIRQLRITAKNTQGPVLRFRSLSDGQKALVCDAVAKMNLRLFVVISNKQNMRRHKNESASFRSQTKAWFYWWVCRLLIERVSDFCEHRNEIAGTPGQKIRFEFSRRKDLNYSELTNYLAQLWVQGERAFLNKRLPKWSVIDLQQIYAFDHHTRAGLQLADIVASAFYRAVNRDGAASPNPAYAEALDDRVWRKGHVVFGEGFTVFPFPLRYPGLTEAQKRVFRFYGYPPHRW